MKHAKCRRAQFAIEIKSAIQRQLPVVCEFFEKVNDFERIQPSSEACKIFVLIRTSADLT